MSVDLAAFLYPKSIKVAAFQGCGTSNVVVLQIPVVKYLATPHQMSLLVLLRGSNELNTDFYDIGVTYSCVELFQDILAAWIVV